MRLPRVFPLLLAGVLGCSSTDKPGAVVPSPTPDLRTVEERLTAGIARRLELGLGFGYAAAYRDGGKGGVLARGKRSLEPPAVLAETDVFEIGAVSRTFTGILLQLAILEGKLRADTPLAEKFPALRGKPAGELTVAELALHRSGLPTAWSKDSVSGLKERDLLAALENWTRPPGAAVRVDSDTGYLVLGLLLEKSYRRSFSEILRTRLVQPLGLGKTGAGRRKSTGRKSRVKHPVGYDPAGDATPSSPAAGLLVASTGIEMNAREMGTYLERLVNPPASTIGRAITAALDSGFGWDTEPGARSLEKSGMSAGFAADLAIDRDGKRAVFVASNIRISIAGLTKFALGSSASDDFVARIETGRRKAPELETTPMKGKYIFAQLLDDDEDALDPKELPPGELILEPKSLEILEQFGRPVARFDVSGTRVGLFLAPGAEAGEWIAFDGASADAATRGPRFAWVGEGEKYRLRLRETGASGKKYEFEYRKLPTRTEIFPAQEKE